MTIRTVAFAAPFHWFGKTIDSVRRNPRVLALGFVIVAVFAMIPAVPQMIVDQTMPQNLPLRATLYAVSILWGLLVMPPFIAAAFRLLNACERGEPARAGAVFGAWVDVPDALRIVGTAVLMFLLNLVVLAALFALMPAKEFWIEIFSRTIALQPGEQPDMTGLPAFSPWFLLWLPFVVLVAVVASQAFMFAYSRAALDDRSPVAAIVDGCVATARNVLPLVAFSFAAFFGGMVVLMIVSIAVGIVVGIAMLISPVVGAILALPFYVGMIAAMYLLMFGFYYHGWREIFDVDAVEAAGPPARTIAL